MEVIPAKDNDIIRLASKADYFLLSLIKYDKKNIKNGNIPFKLDFVLSSNDLPKQLVLKFLSSTVMKMKELYDEIEGKMKEEIETARRFKNKFIVRDVRNHIKDTYHGLHVDEFIYISEIIHDYFKKYIAAKPILTLTDDLEPVLQIFLRAPSKVVLPIIRKFQKEFWEHYKKEAKKKLNEPEIFIEYKTDGGFIE